MARFFGEIDNIKPGALFPNRKALHAAGIHKQLQAGISGSQAEGADSIVLSGGYVDDEDYGDEIIYTGEGGRDEKTGRQIKDQALVRGNKALALSFQNNLPVRVIRGAQHSSLLSPTTGYRYDGLYLVTHYWSETGRDGFKVWRFKLERSDPTEITLTKVVGDASIPVRITTTRNLLKRDTAKARLIKALYNNCCQVCGMTIKTPLGDYSEAAHIKPLGRPHNGADHSSNILCLCPNHHTMLDYHVFTINDDFSLVGIEGHLTLKTEHQLDRAALKYHRDHFFAHSQS